MKTRKEYLQDYLKMLDEHIEKSSRFKNQKDSDYPDPFYQGYLDALNIAKSYLISEIEGNEEEAKKAKDYLAGYQMGSEWFDHNIRFDRITVADYEF